MIELRTLGTLDLRQDGEEVTAVLHQPKRLGLLAYLAIATPRRYHRRDALLAMFWPELDQSHARAALRRAIYFLRQALGDHVIVGRGDEELTIAETGFTSDAADFELALTAGNPAAAIALYRGDLLEGFFVSQAPEFERWLDLERSRLRDRAASAVKSLADEAEKEGNIQDAAQWAHRMALLQPFDEVVFRRVAGLLERSGDRAGVARAFEEFSGRLKDAYEIEPSAETTAFINRIRTRQADPASTAPRATTPALAPQPTAPRAIAILPFTVVGSPTLAYLGEGMVDLLSTQLEGAGDLRTIDPRALLTFVRSDQTPEALRGKSVAARFGAGFYLQGNVFEAGGRLQMSGSLYRHDGELVATAETRGGVETDIFELVDDLARQLLVARNKTPGARVTRLAALTTGSLPALKAYLRGEHDFRQAKYFDAIDSFQEAVGHDAAFALAYYRLAAATAASAMPELAREAAGRANDHRERLAPRDRLLLDAQRAWLTGSAAEAESLYQAIVANFPEDMEAWFLLGDLLFHSNPLRGRSIAGARHAFERALELEPDHVTSMVHLVRIAAVEGRLAERDQLIDRIIALSPEGDSALPMRALREFSRKNESGIAAVTEELHRARALTIGIAFSDIALYSGNLPAAETLGRTFLRTVRSDDLRALCHIVLAHLLGAEGQWEAADAELAVAQPLEPAWSLEVRSLFAALPFVPLNADRINALRQELTEWNADAAQPSLNLAFAAHNGLHAHLREYLLGLLASRMGDEVEARASLSRLEILDRPLVSATFIANLALSLRAVIAWARGDARATLRFLEAIRVEVWFQLTVASPFFSQCFDRYLRGEALSALGRAGEAAGWYSAIAERSPFELIFKEAAARRI
ncbi:MAG: BTAD domain-containing putative transcriptional regulator [Gemmatimonadota bacterium]